MAAEARACRRAGLEGGREWGLWEPSLSLPWLLGGVGGSCRGSSVVEEQVTEEVESQLRYSININLPRMFVCAQGR